MRDNVCVVDLWLPMQGPLFFIFQMILFGAVFMLEASQKSGAHTTAFVCLGLSIFSGIVSLRVLDLKWARALSILGIVFAGCYLFGLLTTPKIK